MYDNAQYVKNMSGQNSGVAVHINGERSLVPLDSDNVDYANMMALVASGQLTIAPAD